MNWLEWLAVAFNCGIVLSLSILGYWAYTAHNGGKP